MTYSVWTGAGYDYYEGRDPGATPSHLRSRIIHGQVPATAAGWPLPSGARKVGSGADARGVVALGSMDFADLSPITMLLVAGIAYMVFRRL